MPINVSTLPFGHVCMLPWIKRLLVVPLLPFSTTCRHGLLLRTYELSQATHALDGSQTLLHTGVQATSPTFTCFFRFHGIVISK